MGEGGMARVWAARHRGAGVIFALKMLMPHLAENAAFRDMFFDEARIASRIRHDNVARTFELVELDGILTLVMEWVDGSSLVRMLRPGPDNRENLPRVALPLRHAVKIVAETCAGLHAAHDLVGDDGRPLSVVHRDVSPHNVLLTVDGRVKVTDFGVAKALGKSHMTIAGQVKGKLAYMSPEQLVGGGVDRRSDVFALGSVLYEITTGQKPFQGEHDPQVMAAIIMGNCLPPGEVMRGYPKALERIVGRAMATEPDARYATALQLRQALEGWLASSGPPVGGSQIALLLQERCGPELEARLATLGLHAPPPPASSPEPRIESGSAMEVDRRRPSIAADQRSSVTNMGAFLAVIVGVVLGLGVLVYVHNARKARAAAASSFAFSDAAALVAVSAVPDAAVARDIDDPPRVMADAAPPTVRLHVPDGARLYVDGKELPAGTMSVPRPDAGMTTVLVRAELREDALVVIHPTSPDEIDVSMLDKPKHHPRIPRPDPASTITTPPNPYE
jgi:serine/threonine-protein kinase